MLKAVLLEFVHSPNFVYKNGNIFMWRWSGCKFLLSGAVA